MQFKIEVIVMVKLDPRKAYDGLQTIAHMPKQYN